MITSDYLHAALAPRSLQICVDMVAKDAKQYKFDAIAFRGMSGALVAPAVAMKMNKSLVMVRKSKEKTHSVYSVEGEVRRRYIVVDDTIASGETLCKIVRAVKDFEPYAELQAIFIYNQGDGGLLGDRERKLLRGIPLHFVRCADGFNRRRENIPEKVLAEKWRDDY